MISSCPYRAWRRIQFIAKERASRIMQAQIKTLSEQGYSIRSITRILRLSRGDRA